MSVPVEVLITEHKLILQAVSLMKNEAQRIQTSQTVNAAFVTTIVDFFRTYADRFHHGKEEGLLFRELSQKKMNDNDSKIMKELIMEHAFARRTVTALENAKNSYVSGEKDALKDVLANLGELVKLYPAHIEKEDKHFFYPSMAYFSESEKEALGTNFSAFNHDFTDKRYKHVIEALSQTK